MAAHKLARAGAEVPVKPARITIHETLRLTSLEGDTAAFTMSVSAGGYVRSVAHELGNWPAVGRTCRLCGGRRPGPFTLEQAVTVEQLKSASVAELEALLPHPRTILPEMPSVTVDDQLAGTSSERDAGEPAGLCSAPLVKVFTAPTEMLAMGRGAWRDADAADCGAGLDRLPARDYPPVARA